MIKNIKEIINQMPDLPTMPPVVAEALNIIENPKSNVNQLSEIISKDISLTTQILKMVNSAYYGFPSQITTINKAMALLGLTKVKTLILSVAVRPMMMTHSGKSLWEHSIRCAIGCELIAKSLGIKETDEAFVMGLLHDIGKTVLEVYNKNAIIEVNKLVELGAERLSAEKIMFGCDHTEIGQELVSMWKLPYMIGNCIRFHHNPLESDNLTLIGIVYIANIITHEQLKYSVIDPEIVDRFDFEIPNPQSLREEIFIASQPIIEVLSK